MRADRLVATLLVLQRHGQVTAAQVAGELEVSVATARRDLAALSLAGVPVYPTRGRGGGWRLVGGARTDLTGLTDPEARALFALLGREASPGPHARSARRKLLGALPGTLRDGAQAAAEAVVVDDSGWGRAVRPRPAVVDVLQAAVADRRQVRLVYASVGRPPTERLVDPEVVVDKDGVWYLVAGTPSGRRTFRVDRVERAEVTDAPAARPDDLDGAQVWADVVARVERRRASVASTVLVPAHLLAPLREQLGRHCEYVGEEPDGRVRVHVTAPTARDVAQHLAGWGALLEVEGPAEVRAHLARFGAELVQRYGSDPR